MIKNVFGRILHLIAFFIPFGNKIRPFLHRIRGVSIGKNVWISKLVFIDDIHPECISIGDNTTIGFRTTIFAHLYFGKRLKENDSKIVIGKNVFIGPHCLILPNVTIGDGAVIKAGSVVSRNIPPNSLCGPPDIQIFGRVTVPLTPEYSYEEFLRGLRPAHLKKFNIKVNNTKDINDQL